LYLDEQGQIFYGGRQLDPAGLASALSGAPRSHKLIVAADRHLSATVLLDRLAELRRLGFLQVSVLAVRGDGA
jgi:biopolymer transport protein ExbD